MTGRRERNKRATRRALSDAARQLVTERGLNAVTVDDIAEAAGVSVRTFSNYFAGKDEAVVGVDPDLIADYAARLRARPSGEHPVDAVRAVLLDADVRAADGSAELVRRLRTRHELVQRHPALLPRFLAGNAEFEAALTAALAERLGVDPRSDHRPALLISLMQGSTRTVVAWWAECTPAGAHHRVEQPDVIGLLDDTFDRIRSAYEDLR